MRKMILISMISMILLSACVLATISLDITWQKAVDFVRPGSDSTIDLMITNTGTTSFTSVLVTPSAGPDLTVTSGKISLGNLVATASQQASIAYKVNEDAISRTSYIYLDIDYYTGTSSYEKTFRIPITIRREPTLQITNIQKSDAVTPGNTLVLQFDIRNSGQGAAEDLLISLGQSDLYNIAGSSGEVVIDSIGPDEAISVSFEITIDPDADIGLESIPVELEYYDESRVNAHSETKYIGLTVTGDIEFILSVESAIGGVADISIVNRGTGSAEYLNVIARSGGIVKEYYIGSLDSDDTETIQFPNPRPSGAYDVEIELHYKDLFNNEYTETKTITVNPTFHLDPTLIIVLIIIAAGSYWYYRKKIKKKK